jgi:hypothetical protein
MTPGAVQPEVGAAEAFAHGSAHARANDHASKRFFISLSFRMFSWALVAHAADTHVRRRERQRLFARGRWGRDRAGLRR